MKKKTLLIALETPQCPPHHWFIDGANVGRCTKCPAVKDFGPLLLQYDKNLIPLHKARKGGVTSRRR